jgi:L,D-transpeptidase YnhG
VLALAAWWVSVRDGGSDAAIDLTNAQATSGPMRWRIEFEPSPDQPTAASPDPEILVKRIYAQLGAGERSQALTTAASLAAQFPNFQLGQLLYADLLNISSRQPIHGEEIDEETRPSALKRLEELVLEVKRRLSPPEMHTLNGQIPAALTYIDPQQAYVAAVDASRSRMYWFANRTGHDGKPRLELLKETYVSVGINGVGKLKEGDGKTPLGVYFIQKYLPGATLPDLFGVGALTLNYPSAIDIMRRKSGSGIWLHGTPSAHYSRAPESTDGCLVLANSDMDKLLNLPGLRMTPVIIADIIDWVPAASTSEEFADFKPTLDQWLQARNGLDPEVLKQHYSRRFEREEMDLDYWWPKLVKVSLGHYKNKPLQLVSVLRWKDAEDTLVVTMKDPNQQNPQVHQYLRTYWQKEGVAWKLIFEGTT